LRNKDVKEAMKKFFQTNWLKNKVHFQIWVHLQNMLIINLFCQKAEKIFILHDGAYIPKIFPNKSLFYFQYNMLEMSSYYFFIHRSMTVFKFIYII
jgi:hypothetical protein